MSGAKVGDKTMMDALIPASEAIAAYDGSDEQELFAAAAEAAAKGAEATKHIRVQVRSGQELRHSDHRHAGRRGHLHGLFLPGPGAGPEQDTFYGMGDAYYENEEIHQCPRDHH